MILSKYQLHVLNYLLYLPTILLHLDPESIVYHLYKNQLPRVVALKTVQLIDLANCLVVFKIVRTRYVGHGAIFGSQNRERAAKQGVLNTGVNSVLPESGSRGDWDLFSSSKQVNLFTEDFLSHGVK